MDRRTENITIRLSKHERELVEFVVANSKNREKLTQYMRNCILNQAEKDFSEL